MTKNPEPPGGKTDDPPKGDEHCTHNLSVLNEQFKSLADKYEKNNKKNDAYNRKNYRLQISIFVGISIYTIITALILCVSRDTEKRQLRAYLDIYSTAPPKLIKDSPAIMTFDVRNSGLTPAYKVTPRVNANIGPFPEPHITGYAEPTSVGFVEKVINPQRTEIVKIETSTPLSQGDIDQINDGSRHRLYFWGNITFFDAFGVERHVRFCEIMGGPEMNSGDIDCAYRGAD